MLMYDTTLTDLEYNQPAPCQHTHLTLETWGSLRTWGGDLIDDQVTQVVCMDCGEDVPEPISCGEYEELPI